MKIKEYEYAEDLVMMVIKKFAPATILVSEGGLGKSYLVKDLCEKHSPNDSKYFSGHITPKQLYVYLYKNNDKILAFDDVEELLKNDKAVGILKSALWATKGKRIVSYATTERDGTSNHMQFEFTGGVILLLNKIPREDHPIVKALRTRGLVYHFNLTYKQKLRIMKEMLDCESFYHLIGHDLSKRDRKRLKTDLKNNTSLVMENFNFRTMEKLVMFYAYGKEYHPNRPNRHIELHKITNTIDEDKSIVHELLKSKIPISSQVTNFCERTGKSRATYYRIKKALIQELKADSHKEEVSQSHEINMRQVKQKKKRRRIKVPAKNFLKPIQMVTGE